MTTHPAQVQRLRTGWIRWIAWCPCGWRVTARGGREAAELLAAEHRTAETRTGE